MKNTKLIAVIITVSSITYVFAGYWDEKTGKYVPNQGFGKPTIDETYKPAVEPDNEIIKTRTAQEREEAQPVDEARINKKYGPKYR